jgi:hypothetical protein
MSGRTGIIYGIKSAWQRFDRFPNVRLVVLVIAANIAPYAVFLLSVGVASLFRSNLDRLSSEEIDALGSGVGIFITCLLLVANASHVALPIVIGFALWRAFIDRKKPVTADVAPSTPDPDPKPEST